jgi:phosphinothricin acetyltransferase
VIGATIESATEADLPRIGQIMNHAIRETTAVWYDRPKSPDELLGWWQGKIDGDWPVFVARAAGEVAGYATFGPFRPFEGYRFTVEHSLYVDPRFHRQGIGRALLRRLLEQAVQRQRHVMIGGIDATNEASLRLHNELGFVEVGRLPDVGYKFDRWRTLVFVQRTLEP